MRNLLAAISVHGPAVAHSNRNDTSNLDVELAAGLTTCRAGSVASLAPVAISLPLASVNAPGNAASQLTMTAPVAWLTKVVLANELTASGVEPMPSLAISTRSEVDAGSPSSS